MLGLTTNADDHEPLAKRRRYRWAYGGCVVGGAGGWIVASQLGVPLVGIGVYWLGVLGMVSVATWSPVQLFDEREQRREREAAATTLVVVTVLGVLAIPSLSALETADVLTIPEWVEGMFLGYLLLFVIYGIVFVIHSYRS